MAKQPLYLKAAPTAEEEKEELCGLIIDLENLVLDKSDGLQPRMTELKASLSKARANPKASISHLARLIAKIGDKICQAKIFLTEIQPLKQQYTSNATQLLFDSESKLSKALIPQFLTIYGERLNDLYRDCFEEKDAISIELNHLQSLLRKKNLSDEDLVKIKSSSSSMTTKIDKFTKKSLSQLDTNECLKLIKENPKIFNRLMEVKRFTQECLDLIQKANELLSYSESSVVQPTKEEKTDVIDVEYTVTQEESTQSNSSGFIKETRKKENRKQNSNPKEKVLDEESAITSTQTDEEEPTFSFTPTTNIMQEKARILRKNKTSIYSKFSGFFVSTMIIFSLVCLCLFCFSGFFLTANPFDVFVLLLGSSILGKVVG